MRKLAYLIGLMLCSTFRAQAQTNVALSPVPAQQFFSAAGAPLASGCVFTYISGTSTPLATYTDGTGVTQNANPVILDAGGFGNLWLTNSSYRFTIYSTGGVNCATGTLQRTVDNISAYTIINQAQNIFLSCAASDPSGTAGELGCRSDLNKIRAFTTFWDSIVEETVAATLTNKTATLDANTVNCASNVAGQYARNNGTKLVCANISQSDVTISIPNNTTFGTLINSLAKIAGATGTVTFTSVTDTGGVIGIVTANSGLSGNATIQSSGLVNCAFDGATTSGDYVQISTTQTGGCKDVGAAYPLQGQVIGRVLSTNAALGTYQIYEFGPEIKPPGAPIAVNLAVQGANIASTPLVTPPANGFYRASCYLVVTQAATTSSTLPFCNILYTDADSSVAQSFAISGTNTLNTVGTLSQLVTGGPNIFFYAKSGVSISYSTSAYASVGATPMQYALHLRLEGPF